MLHGFFRLIKPLPFLTVAIAALPVSASVSVGGYTFDDNAFVDGVSSTGMFNTFSGSLVSDLTDTDVSSYALSDTQGWNLDLSFIDNVAVNGAGTDIVLFELGEVFDGWKVTINGVSLDYSPSIFTGSFSGSFQINSVEVDLSDFGIAAGQTISSLRLSESTNAINAVSTSLVGALNSGSVTAVPEPATWAMFIGGFGLIGGAMRRKRATIAVSFG